MRIEPIQVCFFVSVLFAFCWGKVDAQNQLEKYIEEGISNNIVLKQKKISLKKALYSLKSATSLFFPSVEFDGGYTSGEGGRNIPIQIGDLLNPVYTTLNQLTQSNRFPQVANEKINFFPFHFYDFKLRTTMPILNTDIIINHNIQNDEIQLQKYEVDIYKRELIKDIKTAYYNYLNTISAEKIYKDALKVAKENKRVNESLLKNGKGLPVYILRSESEIVAINSEIVEAKNKIQTARRYFNFLLNRNLDANVNSSYNIKLKISKIDSIVSKSNNYNLSRREELKFLKTGEKISESTLLMHKLYWVPKISAFLDLGVQDQIWRYNSNSKYYLFGFLLSVPIFDAFRDNYKIDEAELDLKEMQLNLELKKKQIKLKQLTARDNLIAARQNYFTAIKKYKTAKSYERLIEKGYKEGANTFLESVDARSQLTQAALTLNINTNKVLSVFADYEREMAASKINY